MIIVADISRKKEYESKIKYSSFKNLVDFEKVRFLDYESLNKQYENLIQEQKFEFVL